MRIAAFAAGLALIVASGCAAPAMPRASRASAPTTPPPSPPAASPAPAAQPPAPPATFDLAEIQSLLDDPRLAEVKARRDHPADAATTLRAALASASLSPEERAAWSYQLGLLREEARDPAGAAEAFLDAGAVAWPLAPHARLYAARALLTAGQYDGALDALQGIGAPPPTIAGQLDLVRGDALLGKNDTGRAADAFRRAFGRRRDSSRWAAALRLARVLLARDGAEEALDLAQRVKLETPAGMSSTEALEIERRALAALPRDRQRALARQDDDVLLLRRAEALVASGQAREAIAITRGLLGKRAALPKAFECALRLAHAEALDDLGRSVEAAAAFERALSRCPAGHSRRAETLFAAGRALFQAGRFADAANRFAEFEQEAPKDRRAGTARLYSARAALRAGDVARSRLLLSTIDEDYPDSDAARDGLLELALQRIGEGDWAGAIPTLEAGAARGANDRAAISAGCFAYYLARAHIETGAADQGNAELARVILGYPLSYCMTRAAARLAANDPKALAAALQKASQREAGVPFVIERGPWADDAGFARAVQLATQGDAGALQVELDALGVSARVVPSALLYIAARMYAVAGDASASHAVLRSAAERHAPGRHAPGRTEATELLDHYPAGAWRLPWELAYPRPFLATVQSEARQQGVSEALAYAILREEGAFDLENESKLRADLHRLSALRAAFPDHPLLAIPGYHAGRAAVKRWLRERPISDLDLWIESISDAETRLYTKRVIAGIAAYEILYSQGLTAPRSALTR